MLTSLKRIFKNGWIVFSRNLGLSAATIFIMIMVIFLATFFYIFNNVVKILVSDIQEKVDVAVFFKKDTQEDQIMKAKTELSQIPEVKNVGFVSREEALNDFTKKYQDNPVLMESLQEIGENPFLSSLEVEAWEPSQYDKISKFLEEGNSKDLIEKIDYNKRKPVIERIFAFVSGVNKGGILFGALLSLIAVLVALNTIRIAIFNFSEEISTMRLVGASNWFIRGPFLVQGAVSALIAALFTFLIAFLISYFVDAKIKVIAPEISVFKLFLSDFWLIFLIQILTGLVLSAVSSTIAIRRYLKI